MKRRWRRFLAGLLSVLLVLTVLPTQALAAVGVLAQNSTVENAALLEALQDLYGEDAETYMALLESYNLLDEDGNIITDETVQVDGVSYTLEELEVYLDDPNVDLSKVAEVDGDYITLENLKKIIEIERYLAYVQATYFTKQDLTDEQVESFYDLAEAWANGDVEFYADAYSDSGWALSVDHSVVASVSASSTANANGTYTVKVTLNKVQTQDVTFSWRALSGSVNVTGTTSGTGKIAAGSKEATFNVSVGNVQGAKANGKGSFVVQIYDLTNALFSGGSTRWDKTVTVSKSGSFKYSASESLTVSAQSEKFAGEVHGTDHLSYGSNLSYFWAVAVSAIVTTII